MIGGRRNHPVAQFRVREVRNEWHNAVSAKLNWKEGETHHMAGTWGAAGLHLYLDGELAAQNRYKGGPANIIERLSINNNETDPAKFPTYSIVDELKIHGRTVARPRYSRFDDFIRRTGGKTRRNVGRHQEDPLMPGHNPTLKENLSI